MEPTFLSPAPQRTADYMRARDEGKLIAENDFFLPAQRLIFKPFLFLNPFT